jgi:lipoprotein-releasing system permease protein
MYLAMSFLKKRRRSSFLAILGMAFSFTALTIGLGISNGLSNNTVESMLFISPHIKSQNRFGTIKNYDKEVARILEIDNVKLAYPKINGKAMISYKGLNGKITEGILIEGYDQNTLFSISLDKKILKGDVDLKDKSILIGEELAGFLDVSVGDIVTIVSQENIKHQFTLKAIYATGFYNYDSNFAIISLDNAKEIFKVDGASEIDIKLNDIYLADKTTEDVENKSLLISSNWFHMNKQLLKGIKLEKKVIIFLLSMLLVITSFIISALTSVIIADRKRDIAILRVMGFSKLKIALSFLLISSILLILGILIGAMLSFIIYICLSTFTFEYISEIYYIPDKIPFNISGIEIISIFLISKVIVLVSSLIPVFSISKIDPVEVLKYE